MVSSIAEILSSWLDQFTVASTDGQNRLVYNAQWRHNQQQLLRLGHHLGATSAVDFIGNVCLDFPGQCHNARPIMTGSHMDTVAMGGKYDGLYGILGGLCAIQQIIAHHGRPHNPLRLISFSEEEGSRFPAAFTGSRYFTHHTTPTGLIDANGQSFDHARYQAVQALHSLADRVVPTFSPAQSFTELHIEQGPRLANAHRSIGLVQGIVAQQRFIVTVTGQSNHAGTTPMSGRQDAVEIGCTLISQIYQLAHHQASDLRVTIGQLTVHPNTSNVIAGEVRFSIDLRHHDDLQVARFVAYLSKLIASQPQATIASTLQVPATLLAPTMLQANRLCAQQLGLSALELFSGAGHDSQIVSQTTPTAMIFVPSQGGISHSPDEFTALSDLVRGSQVLAASLYTQAY